MKDPIQGSLFSNDFLRDSIREGEDWRSFDDASVATLHAELLAIFQRFPTGHSPNESQTEDDLIWPVLRCLGWSQSLRQQNLTPRGRDDVPDGLLFTDEAAKARANGFPEEWKRYEFGVAIVESKRWLRPLDRRSGRRGEELAPSTQMLRYLRRVDDVSTGELRWGFLTNGARWRLYYQGARSVSEQFLELDLTALLDLPNHNTGLFALTELERLHWLRVFALVFRREAFISSPSDARTFHQRALDEGRFYEERVAGNLSDLVFGKVFPELSKAIAQAAPRATLGEVRDAALVLLYRLLFILYAEDRNLLPVRDPRYDDYGLRKKVRGDVGRRKDRNDTFSATQSRYWAAIQDLSRAINDGDSSIGLPPYNGGLFDGDRTPLLDTVRLGDAVMADVIDALSFESTDDRRRYINYRDLSVQQLGSIYERLLEHELVRDGADLLVRPNIFARKGSGSYYTPDDLVRVIIRETVGPLVQTRLQAFADKVEELATSSLPEDRRIGQLKRFDPAERLLELKICDPAMGSGHFLVNLVDYLADQVIEAMAEAESAVPFGDYVSPLSDRIDVIRNTILANAEERDWTVDHDQLDDRHIIRRMVLKRSVYGVDKNLMAVELAKVSLWLHTFTVGAPLSFLDHHLRNGNSLFGLWVREGIDKATSYAAPLLLHGPMTRAMRAASSMQVIEGLTDAEIAEAHRSADIFDEIQEMTAPLNALLSLVHALDWLNLRDRDDKAALHAFFDGQFGDPLAIAMGETEPADERPEARRFARILADARRLISEERFLHWQVAFPGVWSKWESLERAGGFDAVIGNPPWDRIKLQQVEWFAARRPDIARASRAADRKRMIAELDASDDPIAKDFAYANTLAEAASRVARSGGNYPLLSGGDTSLNSLFVERSSQIISPSGIVGLLIPSGIATEPVSQRFFSNILKTRSASCCFDFFNRRTKGDLFFPDVYYRFKFSIVVFSGGAIKFESCRFATFIRDVTELDNTGRVYTMDLEHFISVNPNTITAPIYRAARDREIVTGLYERFPILVAHSSDKEIRTWPIRYIRMLDMANDSHLFRTRVELEEKEGAYAVNGNRLTNSSGDWIPLFEGKMVQAFDHRASGISRVDTNLYRTGQSENTRIEQYEDPNFHAIPRYFILDPGNLDCEVAIKDITSTTNARSLIACIIPSVGAGHTLPILRIEHNNLHYRAYIKAYLAASLNSIILDFVARTKILSNHASWYILEQLPVIPLKSFETVHFGPKTAGEVVRDAVLELTYTANDMAPFARDMGYVDEAGDVRPPFRWDEGRRLKLRAKLDAVFFLLYGITDRDDVRYIYSTFPIVARHEEQAFGDYRSRDLCLAYMSALAAGDPDANVNLNA